MVWLYVYLAITVLALVVEFFTSEMVSIWFAGGGVVSLVLSTFRIEWYIHLPVFLVVSALLLICFRNMIMKRFNKSESRINADSAIGKEFILITGIGFNSPGTIKINDVVWNVETEEQECVIEQGKKVIIKSLKGNKYIVEEAKNG